jgi:predicted nucleotidyltransferase component of viral defense system
MRRPRNLGASIRARLLKLAKERNQPFDLLLTRYVLERLLYRLSISNHRDRFILKGAFVMAAWLDDPYRPTRDLDFLGLGNPDPEAIIHAFREVCAVPADDAVTFDVSGLTIDRIREQQEEGGLRVKTTATVGGARVRVLVDIGFGDAIEPGVKQADLPVLLDQPTPRLRAYSRETVVAEKFQAMVMLGRANSRMKDFYDIWVLARSYQFTGDGLARAIAATFARRRTAIPTERPDAFTSAFADDPTKQREWAAFVQDVAIKPASLGEVIGEIEAFLMPHAARATRLVQ